MEQLEDSVHFLTDDVAERQQKLDEQFVSSGGIIPPTSGMGNEDTELQIDEDSQYTSGSAEQRIFDKLQQVVEEAVTTVTTSSPAEEHLPPNPMEQQQPLTEPAIETSTPPPSKARSRDRLRLPDRNTTTTKETQIYHLHPTIPHLTARGTGQADN